MMFLSKNRYFSVQKVLIYYTVNKSHHNSFILLVFSHVANFRYMANFRFLTLIEIGVKGIVALVSVRVHMYTLSIVINIATGTNNARLAQMLRQLAIYHSKDPNNLFCVRIAQGLTHLGKGTLTVCPYHSDRQILSPAATAGLMAFLVSCLDVKNSECLNKVKLLFSEHGGGMSFYVVNIEVIN